MKLNLILAWSASVTVIAILGTISFFAGCATSTRDPGSSAPASASGESMPTSKGGAQLWAENCMRCHNSRSPSSYSDAEWEVSMLHMRVRANLTAKEHESILEFLKAGN